MSLSRYVPLRKLLGSNKLYLINNVCIRNKSNQVLVHESDPDKIVEPPKFFEQLLDVQERVIKRKDKIEPFAKCLFLSKVDTDILAYPEVLNKEDLLLLDERLDKIDDVIGDMGATDRSILETFKNHRLFMAPLSVFQGGLQSNYTERMRFLEEISKFRTSVALQLNTQWAGIEAIKTGYTKEGFDILAKQMSGENVPVRILYRESISEDVDVADIRITSKLGPDGEWLLNGEKLLEVLTETQPNKEYLVVLACVQFNAIQGFLVHPYAPGVTYKDSSITFSDTPVTMLGEDMVKKVTDLMQSGKVSFLHNIPINRGLSHMRLGEAAIAMGLLKETISYALEQVKGKYYCNKPFAEHELFQNIVAEASTAVYKMESMIYLTTGLEDGFEEPDTELETILCRIFSTKEAVRIIDRFINNLKPFGIAGNLEEYRSEAVNILHREPNESLTTYSTLLGMTYAGYHMAQDIKKMRNPMYYPFDVLKRMFQDRRQHKDDPRMTLQLRDYFHPSLMSAADDLEYSVLRIAYAVESAFIHHGQEIIQGQRDLERINDIVIQVYAMLASIARGSRSYCIGVQNSNREIPQCLMIGANGKYAIRRNVKDVADGKYLNNDAGIVSLAEDTVQMRRAPAEHPLTRVFF